MKFLNQRDYPYWIYYESKEMEKGGHGTIGRWGCGLCCAVMAADRLLPNCNFGLEDAVRIAYASEANCRGGTIYTRFAPAFAEELGLDLEMTSDPERLRDCLRTGGSAVFLVNGNREGYVGMFSRGKHYVLALCEERDGRIAILDPGYQDGKYEVEGRRGFVELKNDVVALCDMQVVKNEICSDTPSFYLFWRK